MQLQTREEIPRDLIDAVPLDGQLARKLRLLVLEEQAHKRVPSISAIVFGPGGVIWEEAVGLADIEAGIETSPDTQYRIGSITKTFTAAAVMQLRDAGALSLDDRVGDHLPEVPYGEPTLRQMLCHSSGLQTDLPGAIWESHEAPASEELMAWLRDTGPIAQPGSFWHYSNLAYALLGEVVARRSGISYQEYVNIRLLEPLGLSRTTWARAEPSANGYFVDPYREVAERDADDVELRGLSSLGGLWSTAGDLARWGMFLVDPDPTVLAPESVSEMRSVQVMVDSQTWTTAWGLGVALRRRGERLFVGHTGSMPGHLDALVVSAAERIGAAVLVNVTSRSDPLELSLRLAIEAAEALPAEPEPWRPGDAPPPELEPLLGVWSCLGFEHVFSYRDGTLHVLSLDPPQQEASVLIPEGPDRFRAISGHYRGELLEVLRDQAGEVAKLYLATYPFTRTWTPSRGGSH